MSIANVDDWPKMVLPLSANPTLKTLKQFRRQ